MPPPNYTYEHGNTTAANRLRFLIPDKPANTTPPAAFSDEELNDLYSINNSDLNMTLAMACEIIATDRAKQAIVWSNAGLSINKGQIPGYFFQRAKEIRQAVKDGRISGEPVEYVDGVDYRIDHFGNDRSKYIGDDD